MKCLTNKIRVLCVVILTTLSLAATAQDRFALVIGNSAYEDTNFLPNTLNDAQLVADTLDSLDFKVTHLQDLDYRGMINARRQFVKQLPSKSVALFYYAGHQVQSGGDHYLLPIGSIDGIEEEYLSEDALSLNRIIAALEDKSELRLLFLDACRDNPLPNADKTKRGVTIYKPTIDGTGTIVSFASQSGKPAYDGDAGNNSIYTKTLVDQMLQPNVNIVDMLEEVKNQVTKATKNTQQPRDNKREFNGSFCFKVEGEGCGGVLAPGNFFTILLLFIEMLLTLPGELAAEGYDMIETALSVDPEEGAQILQQGIEDLTRQGIKLSSEFTGIPWLASNHP